MLDNFGNRITWVTRSELQKDEMTGIQVWKFSVDRNIQFLLTHYQSVLCKEELDKSKCFFKEKDRLSYLMRRIMIRLLLTKPLGCLASEIQFREGKNKKPAISHPVTSLQFNISHSGDCILIAIGTAPIGIDVEEINPTFQFQDIMTHYFTLDEQSFILGNKREALKTFFFLWTRKEAYLKYTAEGLLGELMNMPNLINLPGGIGIIPNENGKFYVHSTLLDQTYYMSIIHPIGISEIQYFEYDHTAPTSTLPSLFEA